MKYLLTAAMFLASGFAATQADAALNAASPSEIPFATWNTFPASYSEVNRLNNVKLMYVISDAEAAINADENLIGEISLLRDGADTGSLFSIGEPSLIMNDMVMMIPLHFDMQTAAGEYELKLPRGLFYQTKYNPETDQFETFEGYQVSAAETLVYDLDPSVPGLLEDVTLIPEAGSAVQSLDNVTLTFNSLPTYIQPNLLGFDDITLVQGETSYIGMASVSGGYSQDLQYTISFFTEQGEEAQIGPGEWKLTIPEGYFMLDGNQSPEITAAYNLCPVVLTPASGSTLSEITYFEVSFPGAKTVEFVGSEYMITLTAGEYSGIPAFNVGQVDGDGAITFRLTPIEGFAEPKLGYISFNIDEGAFLIDGEEGQVEGNSPRIQASYLFDREISQEYQPEPNADEVLCQSWGYTVGFAFDSVASPSLTDYMSFEGMEVKFDDTVLRIGSEYQCYGGQADCAYSIMDNLLTFMIVNPDFHKEGTIKVKISGDAYTLSGKPGFDVEHSWKVVMPKEYSYTLTPAGGDNSNEAETVGSLSEILLVFEDATTAEVFQQSGISLKKSDYSLFLTADIEAVESAATPTFRLTFTVPEGQEMTDGEYELQIRYDTFVLDGVQTWPANYTNVERVYILDSNLSGVDGICTDGNATVTVVATDGRVVLRNASPDSLNGIGSGIYIVNGKKVVIRK